MDDSNEALSFSIFIYSELSQIYGIVRNTEAQGINRIVHLIIDDCLLRKERLVHVLMWAHYES